MNWTQPNLLTVMTNISTPGWAPVGRWTLRHSSVAPTLLYRQASLHLTLRSVQLASADVSYCHVNMFCFFLLFLLIVNLFCRRGHRTPVGSVCCGRGYYYCCKPDSCKVKSFVTLADGISSPNRKTPWAAGRISVETNGNSQPQKKCFHCQINGR